MMYCEFWLDCKYCNTSNSEQNEECIKCHAIDWEPDWKTKTQESQS